MAEAQVNDPERLDKFTLSITREDKKALKQYAAQQDKGALRAPGILRRNSACRVRFCW